MPVVESHGIDIHYEVRGEGPPLVLLHSFLCSAEMWRHQVEPLSARYRVINVELRGHGRSGPVSRPFGFYELVDDTIAVLDNLGVETAIWIGLSIGGMTALRAALTHPDRVAALALLDSDADAEKPWIRFKYSALGAIARTIGLAPIRGQVVRQMLGRTTRREQRELVAEWADRFTAVDIPSVLFVLGALVRRDDVTPRLAEITVPALVLVGDEDVSLPPTRSRALAAGLPTAELVVVSGAGHLSALERPQQVNRAILGFLGQV